MLQLTRRPCPLLPATNMKSESPKLAELREKYHQQIECVRRDDGIEREQLSTQLREIMEAMYEADMEELRESYESVSYTHLTLPTKA